MTVEFVLNGTPVSVRADHPHLLAALREELDVTSAKDGCSPSGQCGCCTVMIDGKVQISCTYSVEKVAGRSVTTLEGVDADERQRFADAFASCGGLQCGFCIPGIVMRAKAQIDKLKSMARAHGRETRIWIHVYVVCRPTEKEAQDYLHRYVYAQGDWEAAGNLLRIFGVQTETLDKATLDSHKAHFIAGHGGYPLVGTSEQIVDELGKLADIGVDGCLISWVDYKLELAQWVHDVLPLCEQAGLTTWDASGYMVLHLSAVLRKNASEFVGAFMPNFISIRVTGDGPNGGWLVRTRTARVKKRETRCGASGAAPPDR